MRLANDAMALAEAGRALQRPRDASMAVRAGDVPLKDSDFVYADDMGKPLKCCMTVEGGDCPGKVEGFVEIHANPTPRTLRPICARCHAGILTRAARNRLGVDKA